MKSKKRIVTLLVAVVLLLVGYVLTRYMLFDLHGMKQWPFILLIVGIVVVGISCVFRANIIPLIVSAGYSVSFLLGVLFQTTSIGPGGMVTNNLWIIWTVVFLFLIVVGVCYELIGRYRNKKTSTL